MARTTKKRRRKHRGTQGGSLDRRGRTGRPRSRQEARAKARKQMSAKRGESPPSWRSAILRGAFGAVIFMVLLVVIFRKPIVASTGLAALMLLIYIPLGFYIEKFLYSRRMAAKRREHGE